MRHSLTLVNPATRRATCAVCGPAKIRRRARSAGWKCRAEAPGGDRLRTFGLSPRRLVAMLEAQGYRCPICGRELGPVFQVDHDHETGRVRGLLCGSCNHGLGCFRDDVGRLLAAVRYLGLN